MGARDGPLEGAFVGVFDGIFVGPREGLAVGRAVRHWDPEVPNFFFWGKKKCPSGALVWSANCYVRFFVFF